MDEFGIHLETDSWDFDLLRENDRLLMDIFIDALAPQEDLTWLNICRMHLHAVTLSDIVTADGLRISDDAWNGRRNSNRHDRYNWPRTFRPNESAWNIWRSWLTTTVIKTASLSRSIQSPLGPWLDEIDEWNWVFSYDLNALYHRQGHIWVRCLDISSSPHLSNRSFSLPSGGELFDHAVKSLPSDIKRASVYINPTSTGVSRPVLCISGIGEEKVKEPELSRDPSLKFAWKEAAKLMTESYGWVPDRIVIKGDEQYLFECLLNGSLRMVSDGSYKNGLGSAVVQLRPKMNGHIIWIYCQTPGQRVDQSAFRGELIGLLAGIMAASWLLSEWSGKFGKPLPTKPPTIHAACDGIEALRHSFVYKLLSPQQPQFDLIPSIRQAISASGIVWVPRHVKGHADKHKSWKHLDWWEKRNCEVDKKATAYRAKLEAEGRTEARNSRFFSEPCALFINGIKESSLKRRTLEDLILFPQLLDWWEERGRLSRQGAALVDWDVVGRAMKALPDGMQRWCTKHTAGMCAVGTVRKARKLDTHDQCPMCGHTEDHCHVPRCGDERATTEWEKRVSEFLQWSLDFGTAPEITEAFNNCLRQIREPAHKWSPR